MMSGPTLTAATIALDEARDLPGWLDNVLRFAEEAAVIVDAGTSDSTREVLREAEQLYPGRVRWIDRQMNPEEGFAGQRNASIDLATSDWVIHMDVDMRATPELGSELREAILDESKNGYYYRLLNYFLHHPVKGGGWAKWNKAWIGRRDAHRFENHIHEVTRFDGGESNLGQLEGLMWHLNDESFVERVGKNLRYMQGSGRSILARGFRVRWYHMLLHPGWRAVRTYFFQGGWRDGTQGFLHALMTFSSVFNWWAYAWNEQNYVARADLEHAIEGAWERAQTLLLAPPPSTNRTHHLTPVPTMALAEKTETSSYGLKREAEPLASMASTGREQTSPELPVNGTQREESGQETHPPTGLRALFQRNPDRPLSAWLIERIPQTIRLRSGLRVRLRNHADVVVFWSVFSSKEYLALVHDLDALDLDGGVIVDCGAGIGMFSLLVEHLHRVGLLDLGGYTVEAIEPAAYNVPHLRKNLQVNLPEGSYTIHEGVVGQRTGSVSFYESPKRPWSGSLIDRPDTDSHAVTRPYIDLASLIGDRPCLLKIDIEGGEFDLVDTYRTDVLTRVKAVIVEWHDEMGDVSVADAHLKAAGLRHARRSLAEGKRMVDLYLRD